MHEVLATAAVFLIGVATGFLDSTVGAGGSVSIPALIFVGLSPQVAIATDRFGSVGQTLAAISKFWKSGKIRWSYLPLFIAVSLVGTAIGTHILLNIDTKLLQRVIGIVLLLILPLSFLKKEFGTIPAVTSAVKKVVGFIVLFVLYILNGLLGVGTGGVSFYNSAYFFGFTFIEANATGAIPWFLLSIFSLALYAHGGIVDIRAGIVLLIGMTIGGYFGAHVALQKGDKWIKGLLALVVAAACIKLLIF